MLMEVKNEIKVMFLSTKYNIMREMVNPLSFVLNILFMMLNNATFIIQWIIFFSLVDNFGGYDFKSVMLIWGIVSGVYGITHIFYNGAYKIADYIEDGTLDTYLVLPKNILCSVITSSTEISAIGDLLYGVILLLVLYHKPMEILFILIALFLGASILKSATVIWYSITFWFIRSRDFSETMARMFASFGTYPDTIFNKPVKILMYTIVPAGFIVFIPTKAILKLDIKLLLIEFVFCIFLTLISHLIFNIGLKRYSSTNLMVSK